MTIPPVTDIAGYLRKGIAAARSGRSIEARHLLQQVVQAQPQNEVAWLWLSALMPTSAEKRACLEHVLQANSEHFYARAGLARLQNTPSLEADALEARLASAASGNDPTAARARSSAKPEEHSGPILRALRTLRAVRDRGKRAQGRSERTQTLTATSPYANPSPQQRPPESLCPACDAPISPTAKRCHNCFMTFKSVDELLGRDTHAAPPASGLLVRVRKIIASLRAIFTR